MKTRAYSYRIYPTGKQAKQMETVLYVCSRLWNYFLNQKIEVYKATKKSISCYDQIKEIPQLAIKDEVVRDVYAQVLQDVPRRLDKAFQMFFRRIKQGGTPGFPRFKGKDRYNSFLYPQNNGACFKLMEDGKLYLSKIGCVKIAYHREAKGNWKTCTVKKTCTGKWYIVITAEQESVKKINTKPAIGIDLGLKEFAVLSDGTKIKRARFFKAEEKNLAKAQRKLAKQIKGTKERKKAKRVVARVYERITNKRNNFTHQASRTIANKYGTICIENLNIKGMLENPSIKIGGKEISAKGIHRSIADVAWNEFSNQLTYKAEDAGGQVIKGNPKGTTQKCRVCGKVVPKDLSVRIHKCSCGNIEDRDSNASKNILAVGLHSLADRKVA